MKQKLFLTGLSGCGKSTLLAETLEDTAGRAGGFLTVRKCREDGRILSFDLIAADGSGRKASFLDFTKEMPVQDGVFSALGTELLQQAKAAEYLILDEIGGMELLEERFAEKLYEVLEGNQPCIGVLKGRENASKLTEVLGLTKEYQDAAETLWEFMQNAPDIQIVTLNTETREEVEKIVKEWVLEYACGRVLQII